MITTTPFFDEVYSHYKWLLIVDKNPYEDIAEEDIDNVINNLQELIEAIPPEEAVKAAWSYYHTDIKVDFNLLKEKLMMDFIGHIS